jgi:hypothetical protein
LWPAVDCDNRVCGDEESVDVMAGSWNAERGFEAKAKVSVSLARREELAQALRESSELVFVDLR